MKWEERKIIPLYRENRAGFKKYERNNRTNKLWMDERTKWIIKQIIVIKK